MSAGDRIAPNVAFSPKALRSRNAFFVQRRLILKHACGIEGIEFNLQAMGTTNETSITRCNRIVRSVSHHVGRVARAVAG